MPFPPAPPGASGPIQGLQSAKPAAPPQGAHALQGPNPADGGDSHLTQAAGQLLHMAVQQFGPEIIMVLKQLLDSVGQGSPTAGAEAQL